MNTLLPDLHLYPPGNNWPSNVGSNSKDPLDHDQGLAIDLIDNNELDLMDNDLKPSRIDLYNQAEKLPPGATESSESSYKDQKFIAVEDAFDFGDKRDPFGYGDQMDPNNPASYNHEHQVNVQSVNLNLPWDISNDANMMEQNIDESSPSKEGNSVDAQFKFPNLFQKQGNRRHDPNYKRWQAMKGKCY